MAVDAAKKLEAEGKKVRPQRLRRWAVPFASMHVQSAHVAVHAADPRQCSPCVSQPRPAPPRPPARAPQVRVVSMPVWELFEEQPESYRNSVLPPEVTARVSVEAGSTFGWQKWVGGKGVSIGIDEFGASAPGPLLYEKYGITGEPPGCRRWLLPVCVGAAWRVELGLWWRQSVWRCGSRAHPLRAPLNPPRSRRGGGGRQEVDGRVKQPPAAAAARPAEPPARQPPRAARGPLWTYSFRALLLPQLPMRPPLARPVFPAPLCLVGSSGRGAFCPMPVDPSHLISSCATPQNRAAVGRGGSRWPSGVMQA